MKPKMKRAFFCLVNTKYLLFLLYQTLCAFATHVRSIKLFIQRRIFIRTGFKAQRMLRYTDPMRALSSVLRIHTYRYID